ncbi:hypothetical protein MVQ25_10615 [Fusobacterium necrophorum]|uniref:hypothetical protein n=1 Tax=Fusobacterium necrophorum TaxID=859 RepID=UPI00254FBC08|nr:hypothetical protein [Fusobacterium necrophorum]MDK4498431.1 hypothetical protein [Fusobacterium necrophorum]
MARWIQDPQYREEIDEVTQELKLPVYKASAKGKFRNWFKESWNKIEDYLVSLKQSLQEQINGKEPSFYKKSGFNLEKTNLTENDSNKLFTAKGALDLFNRLTSLISEKEPKISKLSGFNLSKSDADDLDSSSTLATSKAVKKVKDALNRLNLNWNSITGKPNFGLNSGEFMEGHRLAESLGVKEYAGLISSYGQKIAGNAYYDSNTKKMFYCKETNSYTSANSTYFEPFDNKELLNRLNNLHKLFKKIIENDFIKITFFHDKDDQVCYGFVTVKRQFRIGSDRVVCDNPLHKAFGGIVTAKFKGNYEGYFFRGFFLTIEENHVYADIENFTVYLK